jgi:hypothetical protein
MEGDTPGPRSTPGLGEDDEIAMSETSGPTSPPVRVLKVVADGLEEIGGHFVWEGIAGIEDSTAEEEVWSAEDQGADGAGDGADDGPYEEPYYTAGFDREDVEIAIDAFLSHLLHKRLIRKDKSGRLPSFAGVFRKLFGEDHQVAKAARNFQDQIVGYFGWIDYENMIGAYAEFLRIQSFIKKELERSGGVENKELFD